MFRIKILSILVKKERESLDHLQDGVKADFYSAVRRSRSPGE